MPYKIKANHGNDSWTGVTTDISKRIIYLSSQICPMTADAVISSILCLDDQTNPINLVINSEGGDVYSAIAIYDTIKHLSSTVVRTFGIGKVMSGAVLLLAAGAPGHRYVTPNCRLMLHMVSTGTEGPIEDIHVDLKEAQALNKTFVKLTVKNSSVEAGELWNNRDKFLGAKEAVRLGLADHISKTPISWLWNEFTSKTEEQLADNVAQLIVQRLTEAQDEE